MAQDPRLGWVVHHRYCFHNCPILGPREYYYCGMDINFAVMVWAQLYWTRSAYARDTYGRLRRWRDHHVYIEFWS